MEFCGNSGNCTFSQNLHTRKLCVILVFCYVLELEDINLMKPRDREHFTHWESSEAVTQRCYTKKLL